MKMKSLLFLLFISLILVSCVPPARHIPPNYSNPVYSVALLPLYNATNDVDGPRMVREEFSKRIKSMHYDSKPLKEVDQILLDKMGITLGAQLELTDHKKLGETLGVDGVIYGYLLNFDDVTTGLYNMKKVRAGFKLVDTRTGRVIWSHGLGVKSGLAGGDLGVGVTLLKEIKGDGIEDFKSIKGIEQIPGLSEWHVLRAEKTEKVGDAAMLALGEKLLSKAVGVHLKAETDEMLGRLIAGFPAGPGHSNPGAVEKGVDVERGPDDIQAPPPPPPSAGPRPPFLGPGPGRY
ncbi:MAG: DUF799 family lipoprotein [Deltaproteobacteria bacterium]|nr:DUF799 family lipoprotein [Deltaproteobacteria bacterium]